ncbi:developmental pluripotency-associated protein 3-like [Eptesicus fuscus]|uniref:developmental pluripotency-associated protein 3-like n=1 Tax=Eptesicus fuscus TaxID=29078 RepID=UPI00101A4664|nr:developmental pluripotency-associated protein 3-like [Eptesicus fuscus]
MDSPMKCNDPSPGSFSQMSHEGYSADTQAVSEALAKNLSNLTLNPSIQFSSLPQNRSPQQQDREEAPEYVVGMSYGLVYRRRRGVRTMASLKRDLKGLFPTWLRRRNEAIQNRKKNRNEPVFQCGCSHCLSRLGPSSGISENCDMKSF